MTELTVDEEVEQIMDDPDFILRYWGSLYKFGVHGFVYRWSEASEAWYKSEMEAKTLAHRVKCTVIRHRAQALLVGDKS